MKSIFAKCVYAVIAGIVAGAAWWGFTTNAPVARVAKALNTCVMSGDIAECELRLAFVNAVVVLDTYRTEDHITVSAPIIVMGKTVHTSHSKVTATTYFRGETRVELVKLVGNELHVRIKPNTLGTNVVYAVVASDILALKDDAAIAVAKKQEALVVQTATVRGVKSTLEQHYPGRKVVVVS